MHVIIFIAPDPGILKKNVNHSTIGVSNPKNLNHKQKEKQEIVISCVDKNWKTYFPVRKTSIICVNKLENFATVDGMRIKYDMLVQL